MAVDFRNSETKDNLMRAFAGESQARNRYTFGAGQAKREKQEVISRVFLYTAEQEKEHAEIFYKHLKELAGETIHVDGGYPVDLTENLAELLRMAQHNEYEEHDDVYKKFGDKAKEEDLTMWPGPSTTSRRSRNFTGTVSGDSRNIWSRTASMSPM